MSKHSVSLPVAHVPPTARSTPARRCEQAPAAELEQERGGRRGGLLGGRGWETRRLRPWSPSSSTLCEAPSWGEREAANGCFKLDRDAQQSRALDLLDQAKELLIRCSFLQTENTSPVQRQALMARQFQLTGPHRGIVEDKNKQGGL